MIGVYCDIGVKFQVPGSWWEYGNPNDPEKTQVFTATIRRRYKKLKRIEFSIPGHRQHYVMSEADYTRFYLADRKRQYEVIRKREREQVENDYTIHQEKLKADFKRRQKMTPEEAHADTQRRLREIRDRVRQKRSS